MLWLLARSQKDVIPPSTNTVGKITVEKPVGPRKRMSDDVKDMRDDGLPKGVWCAPSRQSFVVNPSRVACDGSLPQPFYVRKRAQARLLEHSAQRQKAISFYGTRQIVADDD